MEGRYVMIDNLKNKLRSRRETIGSWISFPYEASSEIMSMTGFDWLAIDMERSQISIDTAN